MELARHFEIPFLETSAKNSVNVENSFVTMSKEIKKNVTSKGNSAAAGEKKHVKFGGGNSVSQTIGLGEVEPKSDKKKSSCCN